MDVRTREAVRYLGYGKCAVDEKTLQMIRDSFEELEKIAECKRVYRIFAISFLNENELQIGNIKIQSKSLYKNLTGCSSVAILGATLGIEVDRQIRRYEITDMARAVVLQACATVWLEEYCDELQAEIGQAYARPRFSPGYGDFSITHQRDILQMLETSKTIGLSMTDGYMLTPTKSVTALIGISETKVDCHNKGCEECNKAECLYRRSESCYEIN